MPDLICEWCGSIESVKMVMDGSILTALCEECGEDLKLGEGTSDYCDCGTCRRNRSRNFVKLD